jgi:MFS family permease
LTEKGAGLDARTRTLRLLGAKPAFRLFILGTLTSSLGTWLAFVALVIDVFDRTEDARWVSALLVVDFLPVILVGFLAAPLVDRFRRRHILIGADVARAIVFCILPFATSALQIVALALAAGIATSLFRPAVYAGLPNLVSDDDLPQANGLLQTADNLTWTIGPLVGGGLVAAVGPDPAYWFNAATFVVSAALIRRIRVTFEEEERGPAESHWRSLVSGLRVVVGSRPLLTVLLAWSVVMFGFAGVNVAEVVLAKQTFGAGDFGYGLLVGAGGLGLVGGSFLTAGIVERRGVRFVYSIAIAVIGIGYGAAAGSPNVWLAAFFLLVAGVGNGSAVVCNALLVQRGAPDRLRGRAFTVLMGASYSVLGLGMIAAGPLTNSVGARNVWGIAAGLCAAGAVAALALLGREAEEEPVAAGAL